MKMPIADVADRYSILVLKRFHELQIDEDLEAYERELGGVNYDFLSEINGLIWNLEEAISGEGETEKEEIGRLCLRLRELTKLRVEAKNKIAQEHGGPVERKTY